LTLDGTVTRFLETWHDTPVQVLKLGQARHMLTAPDERLAVPTGTEVIAREVLLRAPELGLNLAYARSHLVISRLPEPLRQALRVPGAGLGRILDELRLETYRQILSMGWAWRRPAQLLGPATPPLLCRTYRVFAGGAPLMLIRETFPVHER